MDRTKAGLMRAYLEAALTRFEEHFDVQVTIGNISFTTHNATVKLQVADVKEDGFIATKEATDYKRLCHQYGLMPDLLGQEFDAPHGRFKLDGIKTQARKYPFVATRLSDGISFKFPVCSIKRAFGIAV